jgi:hypothetical protein
VFPCGRRRAARQHAGLTRDELSAKVNYSSRQALLARADPPLLYVLLDEGVLHRPVGTPDVMAGQLARLAELSEQTYVTLQVIPYSAGAHALRVIEECGRLADRPFVVVDPQAHRGMPSRRLASRAGTNVV